MSGDIMIEARSLTKNYRIWNNPGQRLLAPIYEQIGSSLSGTAAKWFFRKARSGYRDFRALEDVSLEVRKGEALGIIGLNGSGKSTLLQIIAGTLQPSTGSVAVSGRVAALLELGSGFNPEFTGRENVYLTASVLGLGRRDTDAKFDEIAAFADIGEFLDEPIKTYSSGMVMRLAFSVAAHVDPDILIIDEALSVGDARFQLKCARALDRFIESGVTLLFVSHDSTMIKRLCQRAILLNRGRLIYTGHPNDVINLYSKLHADGGSDDTLAAAVASLANRTHAESLGADAEGLNATQIPGSGSVRSGSASLREKAEQTLGAIAHDSELDARVANLLLDERLHVQVSGQEFSYGGNLGKIREVSIQDEDGEKRTWFASGEKVQVKMTIQSREDFPEPIFALTIKGISGIEVYGTNSLFSGQSASPIRAGESVEVTFSFSLNLMPGFYFLSFGFTTFLGQELLVLHRRYDAIKVEVHGRDRTFGIANLNALITTKLLPSGKE